MGSAAKSIAGGSKSLLFGGGGQQIGFSDPESLATRRAGARLTKTALGRIEAEAGAGTGGGIERAQVARERVGIRASAQDRLRAALEAASVFFYPFRAPYRTTTRSYDSATEEPGVPSLCDGKWYSAAIAWHKFPFPLGPAAL